jgi:hypothetical protein
MASAVKILQIGINDLGVVPRDKSPDQLPLISKHDKKWATAQIKPDANNEYNITENLIASALNGELYDKDVKILEWYYDDERRLIVESYTDRQVNLFADLKVKECLIKAKGPLYINGKVESESAIAIKAEALWLAKPLTSAGEILLNVHQGVGLLAPVKAQNLIIDAAYVHQEAELQLSGQLDISTKYFKQDPSVRTTVNSLRLITSDQCQMRGHLAVNNGCLLTASALVWGNDTSESTLRLQGDIHIHAKKLHILGDTQVRIEHLNHNTEGSFIVEQDLLVDETALVDAFNTKFSIDEIENEGELSFHQCTTKAKKVQQHGIFDGEQSLVTISQDFIHGEHALTELKDTNFTSPVIEVHGGKFTLEDCNYKGHSCTAYAGSVDLINQSEIEINKLWLGNEASSNIKNCKINAHQSIETSGEILFENADVNTNYLHAIESKTTIKNSKINAQTQMRLRGTTELTDSQLAGEIMTLNGNLLINDVWLDADALEIKSENAVINSLFSHSEILKLQGSKKEDEVVFKKSALTAKLFSCLDHVTLERCSFYGVSPEKLNHSLHAHLKIKSSKFITESQLSNDADSQVVLDDYSTLRVGLLHSQGAMKAKDSKITCENLWQENAKLKLDSSSIRIKNTLNSQASKIKLKKNAVIQTSVAQIEQGSEFKLKEGSALVATSAITAAPGSTISSNESSIFTKKFTTLGRTELCSSLLSAEELLIYDQFEANSMSKVTVDELIAVAKEARVQFSDSIITSNDIQTFGEMVVSDSVIAAKNKLSVWSPATMTLEGNSVVIAEDMVVRGTLITQNKAQEGAQEEKEKSQEKAASQLRINGQLHVTECATVKGTADLFIEADQYLHSGSMNLNADLKARGGLLRNFGSFKAESIYLGFDDKVANFGSFSAKEMTVHSNLLNLAGRVYVEKSLSVGGFYGANFGLIAANNYSNTTLLAINGGLVLPNFSADPDYIFSLGNLGAVGKIAATTLVPNYSNAINLAFMAPGLVNSAYSLYDISENFTWERYRNMRRHEWMAQVCQFKGITSAAWSAFDVAYTMPGEFSNLKTDLPSLFDAKIYSFGNFKTAASKVDWQRFGTRTAGVFLGNYADNALIDINLGVSLTPSTVKKSLFSINTGAEASLLSHTVENNFFYNSGWSGGGDATFITNYTYNAGSLEGLNQFTFKAKGMINTGVLDGNNVNVTINHLSQEGKLSLHHGQAKITEFIDTNNTSSEFTDMLVTGVNFDLIGHLDAERTQFVYTDKFTTHKDSTSNTKQVVIQAHVFSHGGQLDYEEGLYVEANKATLEKGSIIDGKKTDEEELYVPKAKEENKTAEEQTSQQSTASTTETVETEVEKEFKPQHMFIISSEEKVTLDGTLTGGDYTSIQGKRDDTAVTSENSEEKKSNKVKELIIGDNANIKLAYGSIEANNVVNDGQTELSKFSLNIDKLEQQKTMSLEGCVGQVTEFRDRDTATTKAHGSFLKGDSFQLKGELDTKNTHYEYKTEFLTEESSHAKTDNIEIITAQFEHGGELAYENVLSVKADRAHTKIGSVINGKKTAEDELFTPKTPSPEEQTTQTPEGQTTTEVEVEKEFKPQNIFTLEAKNVVLEGAHKGGDYTSIKGKSVENADGSKSTDEKCESLVISDSADVDLTYGSIASDKADISAQTHLKGFNLDIGKTQIHQGGQLALEDSVYNGDILSSDGVFKLDHSTVTLNQMNLSNLSKETIKDSRITTNKLVDNSQLSYQGQAAIFTDHYEHGGRINKLTPPEGNVDNNLFYVKAKTADLHGSSDIDNAIFAIDHFPNGTQFVSGIAQYNHYTVTSSLMLETQDYMNLDTPFYRDCDLTVKASGITMTADYNKARDLSLISTAGDVSLLSNIASNNLYVKSAGSIRTNHNIYSNELANFEAAGGFYNLGGVVNANTVAIKASEIKNISAGSYAAGAAWGVPMGGAGIINGRTDAYLEATAGNIENYGGVIRSGNYTQLVAQGSVINACNIRTSRGAHDWITAYDGGLIAGGSGSGTDGVGLYIKAGGKVYSDASNFASNGINYIEGDQGIEFAARQETHVTNIKKTKTWYGKSSKSVTTATTVTNSTVQSATGVNILVSEHGGVKSVATNFISPGGTQIYARDNVELYSLKTQSQKHKSSSSLWGLSKHSTYEKHQEAVPTLFLDNGVTRIHSSEGSIDARGAYFAGAGDLDLKAHGRIKLGVDLLDHEVVEKTRSLGVSVPGMGSWQAWKSSGSLMDAVTAEDATMAKLNSMLHSNNATELLANSSNLGINLYNTTNSLMRGLSNDTLGSEVLARYGLGGTDGKGFSPSITFSMTESTTKTKYQTQGIGGVNRGGNVSLEAGEGIDLENGVRVHAGGNMIVNAPEIIATAAGLHSSVNQTTTTQSVGISPTGQLQDASIGYSHTNTKSTQYVNAELSADGHMQLGYQDGAMRQVTLDGAVIKAGSMDAKIEHLNIIDKQDITTTKTESFNASLSGQVSAYVGKGDSAVVRDHSGIFVEDNTGHSVVIDEAHMKGGKILVNGGQVEIGKLVSEKLVDHESYTGIGISLNINDLQRLTGQEAVNQTGEQAIAVGELTFDRVNYKAEHTPVVYGENGTHIEIKEVVGEVHTQSADGTKVIKNNELHLTLDVPITNASYIEKSRENIQAGIEKISTAMGLNGVPEVKLPIQEEPVLPSRRKEEEEEEEEEVGEKAEEEKESDLDKKKEEQLTPEQEAALWQEILSKLPLDKQRELLETLNEIQLEQKNGDADPETKDRLKNQLLSAFNSIMKASSEEIWGKLAKEVGKDSADIILNRISSPDALSKLNIKTYFGTRGTIYISFVFNLFGASLDGKKDVWNDAIKSTVGDITLNFALKATGSYAGPIGWAFVGIGVFDKLFYNKEQVKLRLESADRLAEEANKALGRGEYFNSTYLMQASVQNARMASNAEMIHGISERLSSIGGYVCDTVRDGWNKIRGKETPKPPTVVNRNSFFSPGKSGTKKNEVAMKPQNQQEGACNHGI